MKSSRHSFAERGWRVDGIGGEGGLGVGIQFGAGVLLDKGRVACMGWESKEEEKHGSSHLTWSFLSL